MKVIPFNWEDLYFFFFSELLLLLSRFSRVRLCDPRDGSPPGSPVPEILQARTRVGCHLLFWASNCYSHTPSQSPWCTVKLVMDGSCFCSLWSQRSERTAVGSFWNRAVWLRLILDVNSAVVIYLPLKYLIQLGKERFES